MQLAILHTNEGANRSQAHNKKTGEPRFSFAASKAKDGERSVKPIKQAHKYGNHLRCAIDLFLLFQGTVHKQSYEGKSIS